MGNVNTSNLDIKVRHQLESMVEELYRNINYLGSLPKGADVGKQIDQAQIKLEEASMRLQKAIKILT